MSGPMEPPAFVVALLGAESTGKTTLAIGLGEALRARGLRVAVVGEYLREFCDLRGRTPRRDEQAAIAAEQARRIESACENHQIVVADTTALTIAVYSEVVFGDLSLYPSAMASHRRRASLTLLTALDLPWKADGMRDGPHAMAPVDLLFRTHFRQAGLAYGVVAGQGPARLAHALAGVEHAMKLPPAGVDAVRSRTGLESQAQAASMEEEQTRWQRWRMACERCSDPECERRCLFPSLRG